MDHPILSYSKALPNSLTKEDLNDLFFKYQDGDLSAREEIIKHNARLISLVIEKVNKNYNDKEELFSIGMIGLIKAVDTFDLGKNLSFANYACICIKNEMLMFFRKNNRIIRNELGITTIGDQEGKEMDLINNIPDLSVNFALDYENQDTIKVINEIVNSLPEREQLIIKKCFGFNGKEIVNQYVIAKELGISQSHISRLIKKTLQQIKDKLIKLNIIENGDNMELISNKDNNKDNKFMKRKERFIKMPSINEYLEGYSEEERKIMISGLTEKEKNIINKYFFLEGNKPHLEEETANLLGMTVNELNKEVKEIITKMKKILEDEKVKNQIKEEQSIMDIINIINEPKKKGRRIKSIYELLNEYSKEEIDLMLEKLTANDKILLEKRYGKDLENPRSNSDFNTSDKNRFYGLLLPKMKRLLPKRENVIELKGDNQEIINKEQSNIQTLEIFRSYSFKEMLNYLTPKEAVIICLRFGYIDNKYYSVQAISNFLGITELEVLDITKKILLLFKDNINKYLDNAIEYIEGNKIGGK